MDNPSTVSCTPRAISCSMKNSNLPPVATQGARRGTAQTFPLWRGSQAHRTKYSNSKLSCCAQALQLLSWSPLTSSKGLPRISWMDSSPSLGPDTRLSWTRSGRTKPAMRRAFRARALCMSTLSPVPSEARYMRARTSMYISKCARKSFANGARSARESFSEGRRSSVELAKSCSMTAQRLKLVALLTVRTNSARRGSAAPDEARLRLQRPSRKDMSWICSSAARARAEPRRKSSSDTCLCASLSILASKVSSSFSADRTIFRRTKSATRLISMPIGGGRGSKNPAIFVHERRKVATECQVKTELPLTRTRVA
mmetsp:Transcript_36119/g.83210  ORF Transcript_36119/g.83210 Transcript_36119/m.83210 type:complete len:313 (+) Transcript_36119:1300-2238(+)